MEFVASRSLLVDARYHSEEVMWGRVKCIISTVIWAFGWVMGNRRVRLEAPIREYLEAVDAVSVSCICGMSTCESCRGCASSADKDMAETEQVSHAQGCRYLRKALVLTLFTQNKSMRRMWLGESRGTRRG